MTNTSLLLLVAALFIGVNTHATDAQPTEKPAQATKPAVNLTGRWTPDYETDEDIVTIEHQGDKVTASYEYAEDNVIYVGKIEATVKDNTIEGSWSEQPKTGDGESLKGDVKFTIVDDKTLHGKWRLEGSDNWDDWNLQKK